VLSLSAILWRRLLSPWTILALVVGYFGVRDYVVPEIQEYRKFRKRGELGQKAGRGVALEETRESRKAEVAPLTITSLPPNLPAGTRRKVEQLQKPTDGSAPIELGIDAKVFAREVLLEMERRTQLDLDGDGLVDGVPVAQVDAEKRARGGSEGREEAEENPAGDPHVPLGSWHVDPTGRRSATLDVTSNLRTKATTPTITLHDLRFFRFPHVVGLEVGGPLDEDRSYLPSVDSFHVKADWLPLETGWIEWRLGAVIRRDGELLDAVRSAEQRVGDLPELAAAEDEARGRSPIFTWSARIECRSLLRGECGP